MTENKIVVFIYLPGETVAVPAGIFTHESDLGIGSFAYGRKYLERKNALSRAILFGLSGEEASAVVKKLVKTVRGWRDHFASIGCHDLEMRAMEPSFARCGDLI